MTTARTTTKLCAFLLGTAAFLWTAAGETSNPQLARRELPRDIVGDCTPACSDDTEYNARWVGRTPHGDLFVVGVAHCSARSCDYWLVEKDKVAVRTLLELKGAFVLRRGGGRYPAVELRTRSEDDGVLSLRYEWDGRQYTRTVAQQLYEVNGVECGTREQCRAAAEHALKNENVDQALRIWQRVDGVNWI